MQPLSNFVDIPLDWLSEHAALGWWIAALSGIVSIGGMLLVRWFVLSLPHDYFTCDPERRRGWPRRHPVIRWTLLISKNLVGLLLLGCGLTMLVTPGPGIITLLMALVLLDLPGKRALEHRLILMPAVLHTINKLRARANRPAVEMPAKTASR